MALPTTLQTGSTGWGDVGPATTGDGILGREYSEYGLMILMTYDQQNIYNALITDEYSQVLPANPGTDKAQWWRYPVLSNAEELEEGVPPAPTPLTRNRVTKSLKQRGKWIQFTDLERGRSAHPIPSIGLMRLMEVFNRTNDTNARDSLFLTSAPSSGNFPTTAQGGNVAITGKDSGNTITNPTYGGGKSSYSTLTTDSNGADFTLQDIKDMSDSLENNNVPMIFPRVFASTNVATVPGDPAYVGVTDYAGKNVLESLVTGTGVLDAWKFEHVKNYSDQTAIMPNEIGRTGHVRWLWSTSPSWAGTGTTKGIGRRLAILGQDAFGYMTISNEMLEIVTTGGGDSYNPLSQTSTVGLKWSDAYTMLRPDHVRQLFYVTTA